MTTADILRGVQAGLDGAASALPDGLSRTAASGAAAILAVAAEVLDDHDLSVEELVARIRHVPALDTEADDVTVDDYVATLPHRPTEPAPDDEGSSPDGAA